MVNHILEKYCWGQGSSTPKVPQVYSLPVICQKYQSM